MKVRLRHLLRERDLRNNIGERVLSVYRDHGVLPKADRDDNFNKTPQDVSNYKLVFPGDVVVNKMKAWQGSIAVSSYRGIVSGDYLVCRVTGDVDRLFLHHLLRSRPLVGEYAIRSKGIRPAQWRLYWDDLADISVVLPSRDDQAVIAKYVDAETARIDGLIARKQRMAQLLVERQGVAVREAVLYEDSGEPVPLGPMKRRWKVIDCKHRTPMYRDFGFPVVSPGDISPGRLDLSRCDRFVDESDYLDLTAGRRPSRGQIVYSRNASIGIAAYVDTDDKFTMGQDVCLITSASQDQRFLTYVLNTLGLDQLEEAKIGSTFSRVNIAQIAELLVPMRPPEDQRAVADALDRQNPLFDRAVESLAHQIGLLRERRHALIAAAVTGALAVPGMAA